MKSTFSGVFEDFKLSLQKARIKTKVFWVSEQGREWKTSILIVAFFFLKLKVATVILKFGDNPNAQTTVVGYK